MSRDEAKSLRRENLELMLLKKKQCTAKALECVETLIELNVLEYTFRQTLPHINQSTYQDVIDERSITYVCGYPLCSSQLKNIPKKQYSIVRCRGQLTLFDTAERKKFCSNICYKASKFIHDQLPSCPLWLIETKETDQFTLIPLNSGNSRCSYGEEIHMKVERLAAEQDKDCSVTSDSHKNELQTSNSGTSSDKSGDPPKPNDQPTSKDEELFFDSCSSLDDDNDVNLGSRKYESDIKTLVVEDNIDHKPNCNASNSNEPSSEKTNKDDLKGGSDKAIEESKTEIVEPIGNQASEIKTSIGNDSNLKHGENVGGKVIELENKILVKVTGDAEPHATNSEENRKEKVKTKKKRPNKGKHKDNPDQSPILVAVSNTEQKIREWVSVETLNFILGSDKLRNILEEHGLLEKLKTENIDSARDPYLFERYVEICTKLNILDLKDAKFDKEVKEESALPSKPLPDFKKLREEAKAMELKVRSFYAGDKRVQFPDAIIEESEAKVAKVANVLPLVDQHAQHAFRRRIVLDHLNKVLPDVMKTIGISNLLSKKDVRDLVHTFTLSANNVVFKPIEWQFIAIIIVKLFSVRDEGLAKLLSTEKARKYITLILMSYEQDSEYLDRLMTWLLYEHSLFQS
ncbi:hypothetical protein LSTR_LSTR011214 [Laodelphax striatellus]|uniref:RNA polymerase II subunit B1 CTD phosphatase RPAP2 homolog n=1 Tax=Laodelphax striatellus TaxID=195883 RepID=A0A482WMR9_LAOST|nr:hypothetical protein LSTR_LSTR011214 [Laodelphax striatellus]